jgi:hypothetical protein
LLGLLWAVIQTAVLVFLAFLHNLIADLTGGLVLGVVDDTPVRTDTGPPGSRRPPPPGRSRADQPSAVAARTDVSTTQPQQALSRVRGPRGPRSAVTDPPHGGDGDELFAER